MEQGGSMTKKYYVSESAFINVSCDLAEQMMKERLGDKYPLMLESHKNSYNAEGQEHFNQLYEKVQNILEDADIVPNDIKLDKEKKFKDSVKRYVEGDDSICLKEELENLEEKKYD